MQSLIHDAFNWAKDKEILEIINNEKLYYSDKIIKINPYNISQERTILLTDEALYNLHKKKLKRRIPFSEISGITFSTTNNEFVIHGNDAEYDYYYISFDRNLLISLISKFYKKNTSKNLKICKVSDKSLKSYVTGKKEKKKDGAFSKMDEKFLISTDSFMTEYSSSFDIKHKNILNSISIEKSQNESKEKMTPKFIFSKIDSIKSVTLDDFQIIKIIGRSSFGKVYLVLHKATKTYYAMKSLKYEYLSNKNDIEEILVKKQTLQNLNNPFLVGVSFCFQTTDRVYFIMNLIEGENLTSYMRRNKNIDDFQVQFYAAIIGIVIDYLHKNGIDYIGLNTDSILIDKDGYLKISDFKMSKLFNLKTDNILYNETSEYKAPEILQANLCSNEADWWTYGVIIYELYFGIPPFFNENDNKLKELVIKNELKFPKKRIIGNSARELIKKLLVKDPNSRLGHGCGFEQIKNEEFFKDFDFEGLISKKIAIAFNASSNVLENNEFNLVFTYEDLINNKTNT